jgi:hypothetical protein
MWRIGVGKRARLGQHHKNQFGFSDLASGDPNTKGREDGASLGAERNCFSMIFFRRNRKTHGREPLTF